LRRKHKIRVRAEKHFTDNYLYQQLGIIRLTQFRPTCRGRKLTNTLVRKPGAGDRHARFDERDLETGHFGVTAPDLDSTVGGSVYAGFELELAGAERPWDNLRALTGEGVSIRLDGVLLRRERNAGPDLRVDFGGFLIVAEHRGCFSRLENPAKGAIVEGQERLKRVPSFLLS
jgi:hypothetical protein